MSFFVSREMGDGGKMMEEDLQAPHVPLARKNASAKYGLKNIV